MTAQPTTAPGALLPGQTLASDEHLAGASRTDPTAFAELYSRYAQRIYRYHMAHTGDNQDAQDLTTQTFLAALEGIAGFRGTGSFAAWLMGIARRRMAQHYRTRRPLAGLEQAEALADPQPHPETIAGLRLQLGQVHRLLGGLTQEQASAITLCVYGELTAAEAGQVMEKSEAAVKMLLLRGLKELRQQLAAFPLEEA